MINVRRLYVLICVSVCFMACGEDVVYDQEECWEPWYVDHDGDGFGARGRPKRWSCVNPGDGWAARGGDCNDDSFAIKPGATEICDGIDNDCDDQIDEGVRSTFWADGDTDGFGDPARPTEACTRPTGHVTNDRDCDDNTALINPNATEVCDGVDNDCDDQIDEGVRSTFWYRDRDGDGFGNTTDFVVACPAPDGYVATPGDRWVLNNHDCNDTRSDVNPFADELCDLVDNDCDGDVDERFCLTVP